MVSANTTEAEGLTLLLTMFNKCFGFENAIVTMIVIYFDAGVKRYLLKFLGF